MRGQTAAEFLAIFAISLIILLVMFTVSRGQNESISVRNSELSAALSVSDLANAAKEVYAQGKGGRRTVTITLPRTYSYANSRIGAGYVLINAGGTDYIESTTFTLSGSLPNRTGTFQWLVQNDGASVTIGPRVIETNRSVVGGVVAAGSSYGEPVKVTSVSSSETAIAVSTVWPAGESSITCTPSSDTLAAGGEWSFRVSVSTTGSAVGTYSGTVNVTASGGNESQTIIIPVSVDVLSG